MLRVEDLRVTFPGSTRPAVEDVAFTLRRGEVLALVGESGSGKTVTAQAVLGLLPGTATTSGSVQLATSRDSPVGRADPNLLLADPVGWRAVRGRQAAMVFQEPQTALNPVHTIGWQLSEAVRAHRRVGRRAATARAVELLTAVGLDDPVARVRAYPHQLSGGQKQRVVIALALASDPAVLIADEPTTALDVSVQAEILSLLADLRARLGMALLLITHNMGVVAEVADRVLVLRRGRRVEHGAVRSLFGSPVTGYTRSLLSAVPRLPQPDSAPAPADAAGPGPGPAAGPPAGPPALELRSATVDYPGRFGRPGFRALDRVSVAVLPGTVLGVVGESGSGKTTLARAALGAAPVSTGTVLVAGQDVGRAGAARLRSLRQGIGVVHQDPASTLDPLLSVGDSVAEPFRIHRRLSAAETGRRVARLLEQVALPAGYARRQPHELSGGQRQRVAVARALALDPQLLIADEPTSALDASVQAAVLDLFRQLQSELGFACVFISHDLAVIGAVSERVLVLRQGRTVETGPTRTVLTRPQSGYTQALLDAVPVPDPTRPSARARARRVPVG